MKSFCVNIISLFLIACFFSTSYAENKATQNFVVGIKIPIDAEYDGIPLDSTREVSLYSQGQLKSGFLKTDTTVNGITYKAGSLIELYSNGKIGSGWIKSKTELEGIAFKTDTKITFYANGRVASGEVLAGATPNNKNLYLPKDLIVNFTDDGYVQSIYSTTGSASILGVSIYPNAELVIDKRSGKYTLQSGTISVPKLVASLPTLLDAYGRPTSMEPIIAPIGSTFAFLSDNPVYAGGEDNFDVWSIKGKLILNGQDFGYNPKLFIKDMSIYKLQPTEDIIIDGVKIKVGTYLLLNSIGKIYIPKPI